MLEAEKASLQVKLADASAAPTLRLHPNLTDMYRTRIEKLEEALTDGTMAKEAGDILRGLIERIVLTPIDGRLKAELHGDLATIAAYAGSKDRSRRARASVVSVVAGARSQFRLLYTIQGLRPEAAAGFRTAGRKSKKLPVRINTSDTTHNGGNNNA